MSQWPVSTFPRLQHGARNKVTNGQKVSELEKIYFLKRMQGRSGDRKQNFFFLVQPERFNG